MELCVMLEGFCLWNVCIKNNKISETNIGLSSVSLYFLLGFKVFELGLLTEKTVRRLSEVLITVQVTILKSLL